MNYLYPLLKCLLIVLKVQKDAFKKSAISSVGICWISDVLIKMQLLLPVLALTRTS